MYVLTACLARPTSTCLSVKRLKNEGQNEIRLGHGPTTNVCSCEFDINIRSLYKEPRVGVDVLAAAWWLSFLKDDLYSQGAEGPNDLGNMALVVACAGTVSLVFDRDQCLYSSCGEEGCDTTQQKQEHSVWNTVLQKHALTLSDLKYVYKIS